jgi:penicillin-binding protein 2
MTDGGTPKRESRVIGIYGVIGAAFLIIAGQLWHLQIATGAQYRQRADVNRIRVETEKPARGVIYDRAGRQLARNVPSWTASIRPADLPKDKAEQAAVFARLGQIVGVAPEEIAALVDEARHDPFTPARIKAQITREQALILEEQHTRLPGVVAQFTPIRQYTDGAVLGHLLGYTGPLPSQRVENLLTMGYERDDTLGIVGLEAAYEDVLRGAPGKNQVEVDVMGRVTNHLQTLVPTVPGGNLVLTLDSSFQRRATEILAAAMEKAKSQQAALVAMHPQTGEILAMVSLPSFDDNLFAAGISKGDYLRLSDNPWRPLVNHAIGGQFPPGSTFKLVTAAAALQERVVAPQTLISCPGSITVFRTTFRDWNPNGHGNVNVRQAIAVSCDIFFYTVSGGNPYTGLQGLGIRRLSEYAHAFGFGERSGIRLPGEEPGLIPTAEWKQQRKKEQWYIGDDYNTGIGQGDVLATPLQLANMTAAIANGGTLYRPRLVSGLKDPEGNLVHTFPAEVIRKMPVAPEHLALIRSGMRDVVTWRDGSPGREGTALYSLRQYSLPIAGKTGTSEFPGPRDANGNLPTHALFVGYAPYNNPEIAVAVVVYGGGEGSAVAAPAAAEVMTAYFEPSAG